MKLAFIDCSIAGVSGDMLTAALIDAGASAQRVKKAMLAAAKLFGSVEVEIKRVKVNEIKATRVEVKTSDKGGSNGFACRRKSSAQYSERWGYSLALRPACIVSA